MVVSGVAFPLLLVLVSAVQELGRCPVDSVVEIAAGRFLPDSQPQLLVREQAGAVTLCPGPDRSAGVRVPLYRLALLRMSGQRWEMLWRSGLLVGREAADAGIFPDFWAWGDFDGDGQDELVLTEGSRVLVVNFGPDGVIADPVAGDFGLVVEAAGANIELDGLGELVTLEVQTDSAGRRWQVRIWQLEYGRFVPRGGALVLPDSPAGTVYSLLGSARLEDYPGAPVLIAGEFSTLRPSRYCLIYHTEGDTFALTGTPFPYREWFSREEVLPAGRLSLFNVGDTLVAYGYFVPGSGSGMSFAALQEGDWRVLKPSLEPPKVAGLWCRYGAGWLNLRQGRFYLYPQPPFFWR